MNTLTPAQPGSARVRGKFVDILARAADVEGEIAEHAVGGAADLVGERFGRDGGGLGVRHLEDGGDAARDRGAAAGLEVFLVLGARLAEMHLAVDDAGQDVKPGAVDGLGRASAAKAAEPGDPAVPDGDIADRGAVVIDDGSAFQNEIIGLEPSGFLDCTGRHS